LVGPSTWDWADLARSEALLQQARNNEKRGRQLRTINKDYISETDMDQFEFTRLSQEAQVKLAQASIKQAEANLKNSEAKELLQIVREAAVGRRYADKLFKVWLKDGQEAWVLGIDRGTVAIHRGGQQPRVDAREQVAFLAGGNVDQVDAKILQPAREHDRLL